MSDVVERLAAKWLDTPEFTGIKSETEWRENLARWWLNAIADEIGQENRPRDEELVEWLRRKAK